MKKSNKNKLGLIFIIGLYIWCLGLGITWFVLTLLDSPVTGIFACLFITITLLYILFCFTAIMFDITISNVKDNSEDKESDK